MTVVNIRKYPEYLEQAIAYFQQKWGNEHNLKIYIYVPTTRAIMKNTVSPILAMGIIHGVNALGSMN